MSGIPVKHEPDSGSDKSLAPIIFLHSVCATKEYWKSIPQKIANATNRVAYTVDIRNHGDASWSDSLDFTQLKQDVLDLMGRLECHKAVFIGHSLGARIAIQLALENSDKVDKIVVEEMMVRKVPTHLLGFMFAFLTQGPNALREVPKFVDEEEATKIVLKSICKYLPAESVKANKLEEIDKTCLGLYKKDDGSFAFKSNVAAILKAVRNASSVMLESEGQFTGPALFLYGKLSPYKVIKEADHIKKYFPKTELVGIEGARHYLHLDKTEEFLEAVIKFLLK